MRVHVRFRLRECYARFQAANRVGAHLDAAIQKRWIGPLAGGSVEIPLAAVKIEARRNDAHNRVRRAIQDDRFPDDVRRRTEFAFPESSAEHHHRRRSRTIVIGAEGAAENGRYAERRKKVRGNHGAADEFGFARAG